MISLNPFTPDTGKRNQCQLVKDHLEAGNTLSTFDAYRLFNITCLAQRVYDLRHRYGYNITTHNVTHNGKRFAVYSWGGATQQPAQEPKKQSKSKAVKGVSANV